MRSRVLALVSLLGIAALLSACGGGGGSSSAPAPAPKAWRPPVLIESGAGTVFNPLVAIDANSNGLVIWDQVSGLRSDVWANRFTAASNTWDNAALIGTNNTGNAWAPQVAVDANGNALAVWSQYDGTTTNIWAKRFTAASNTWGTAVLIETDGAGDAYDPQISVAADGNALAVWRQFDGTRHNIWANRFTAASNTWDSAVLIETEDAGHAGGQQIAIGVDGNALAVWYQDDGTTTNLWANRFTAASNTWGSAELIETNPNQAFNPQIAIDANGNALAVWAQSDGLRFSVWANRFSEASNTWGIAVLVDPNNARGEDPQIAMGANGNALVVWRQSGNILANGFSGATNTWGNAVFIEMEVGEADRPRIAIDAAGNALAVWSQSDGTRSNVWANRFTAARNTWDSPSAVLIETENAGSAFAPEIAVAANGNALAVWRQSDGARDNVWAARFD